MAIDLMIPTRAWATLKEQVIVISHLTERFGTFFIVVLGQAIVLWWREWRGSNSHCRRG
jgi:low temperature requirement protein LtrA